MVRTTKTVWMKSFPRNLSAEKIHFFEPFLTPNPNHLIPLSHPRLLGVIQMVFSWYDPLLSQLDFKIPSQLASYRRTRLKCSSMPSFYASIHLSIYSIHSCIQSIMCARSVPFCSPRSSPLVVNFLSQASTKSVSISLMNWPSVRSLRGGNESKWSKPLRA